MLRQNHLCIKCRLTDFNKVQNVTLDFPVTETSSRILCRLHVSIDYQINLHRWWDVSEMFSSRSIYQVFLINWKRWSSISTGWFQTSLYQPCGGIMYLWDEKFKWHSFRCCLLLNLSVVLLTPSKWRNWQLLKHPWVLSDKVRCEIRDEIYRKLCKAVLPINIKLNASCFKK